MLATGSIKQAHEHLSAKADRSPREAALLETLNATFPKDNRTCWSAVVACLQKRIPHMVYFDEYLSHARSSIAE